MTFKERINNEKDNLTKIVLYNDKGLFFNLVERSAYSFCTRIKSFKVHVKTLKGLDMPYVSIGVPVEKVDEYLNDLTVTKDDQGNVTALLAEPIDENAFQAWKKHVIEQKEIERTNETIPVNELHSDSQKESSNKQDENTSFIRNCFMEVKTLNLASMTPMEAMLFLNELQIKLKNIDL
ncbi:MAG: hypothetical protein IJ929_05555 [Prevotella sp.]|nr:hypothetical protein [Prevotella sp.]